MEETARGDWGIGGGWEWVSYEKGQGPDTKIPTKSVALFSSLASIPGRIVVEGLGYAQKLMLEGSWTNIGFRCFPFSPSNDYLTKGPLVPDVPFTHQKETMGHL